MCCILEIAMLVYGIIALATGKMKLGQNKFVYDTNARLVGALYLLPLPLAFGLGLVMGATNPQKLALQGGDPQMKLMLSMMEAALVLVVLAIGLTIAYSKAEPKREDRWRPPPRYDDDFLRPRDHDYPTDEPRDDRNDDLPPEQRHGFKEPRP